MYGHNRIVRTSLYVYVCISIAIYMNSFPCAWAIIIIAGNDVTVVSRWQPSVNVGIQMAIVGNQGNKTCPKI